ncbi:hypothetical protein CEUSTIGMA_g9954.t1 [Chlamydomonas eustigma]|uniref:Amine oxidase domain-containing protein n=1 Tax=Chlamydomonas eustigma TaxID=1157962 RepID=A0A250XHH5_9CHLO|nr:hypothetical protein CEUSTIGMA_g9954.t1 [Chlamydomonas eustigma]|eukprot:GAX82527.1 hypothetical protein CEUSTIGMA_g9954.t1 [Chlamydomonas eustigma]
MPLNLMTRCEEFDVIVIGAGIAGLTTAKELSSKGLSVVVLEARDRIGGRLYTANIDGTPVDLGGAWIHGLGSPSCQNAIYSLALRCGFQVRTTDYDDAVFYDNFSHRMDTHSVNAMDRIFDEFAAFVAGLVARDPSTKSRLSVDAAVKMFERMRGGVSEVQRLQLLFQVHNHIESYWAGDSCNMALGTMDEVRLPGADVVIQGGYSQLISAIASGLDVRTGHVVKQVRWRPSSLNQDSKVKAVTCETAQHGSFRARRLVVTLPLGVLKSGAVSFDPPLASASPSKGLAIQRLGTGIYNKVLLLFERPFWDGHTMIHRVPSSAERGRWAWILNLQRVLGLPALVGFTHGTYATQLEARSDQEAAEDMLEALRKLYPGKVPQPVKVVCTRWGSDPHCRMSFTYIPVGSDTSDCDSLRQHLEGTLFFAGEATSRLFYGTVHGAYGSGLMAAQEVVSAALSDKLSWLNCAGEVIGAEEKVPGSGGGPFSDKHTLKTRPLAVSSRDVNALPEVSPQLSGLHSEDQLQEPSICMIATCASLQPVSKGALALASGLGAGAGGDIMVIQSSSSASLRMKGLLLSTSAGKKVGIDGEMTAAVNEPGRLPLGQAVPSWTFTLPHSAAPERSPLRARGPEKTLARGVSVDIPFLNQRAAVSERKCEDLPPYVSLLERNPVLGVQGRSLTPSRM